VVAVPVPCSDGVVHPVRAPCVGWVMSLHYQTPIRTTTTGCWRGEKVTTPPLHHQKATKKTNKITHMLSTVPPSSCIVQQASRHWSEDIALATQTAVPLAWGQWTLSEAVSTATLRWYW
jgi:hypothetical protein